MDQTLSRKSRPDHYSSGLNQYVREIQRAPILELDEEQSLARRWHETNDARAAQALLSSHLRLVVAIAAKYRGYGIPIEDLVGAGNIGLIQALDHFDPERGARFSTYAFWWIRNQILSHIRDSWSLVRVRGSSGVRIAFFKLRMLKARVGAMEEADLTPDHARQIADMLNVSEHDIVDMNRRLLGRDVSLHISQRDDGLEWLEQLPDESDDQETRLAAQEELEERRRYLNRALQVLSDRDRQIFIERRLQEEPTTLAALGRRYGITRERVRQIEVQAFQKVQAAMYENGAVAAELLPKDANHEPPARHAIALG